ncbi:fungal-specific transcription factor domain-containing protein [Mycena olivaceomarginata]|nr:fungal-specific transcription factor domain-containing protein [Mycena olivaceomarginata]
MSWPAHGAEYTLPYGDYDDDDEPDTPGGAKGNSKAVRRRSSKACDQCRKSKCKCERPAPGEPCRSCVLLGTECTSLGPSRKRGPPKGYIDAIEARLHQTEALVGILLAAAGMSNRDADVDERAHGLLADLGEDALARAILARIDQSAYGPAGRAAKEGVGASAGGSGSGSSFFFRGINSMLTHLCSPSHEWMDRVTAHLLRRARERRSQNPNRNMNTNNTTNNDSTGNISFHSPTGGRTIVRGGRRAPRTRRTRTGTGRSARRGRSGGRTRPRARGATRNSTSTCRTRRRRRRRAGPRRRTCGKAAARGRSGAAGGAGRGREEGGADGLAGAVGQLSLNEDKQVRYHGKASGLHLLARRGEPPPDGERGRSQARRGASVSGAPRVSVDEPKVEGKDGELGRNVGGIWRFPKARVWPAAPAAAADDDYVGVGEVDANGLPPRATQEALLARYFTHVHPSFPVVHKRAVQEAWARGEGPSPLLLLAMFALAARHAPQPSSAALSPDASRVPSQHMWPAGDAFLFRAKALLDSSYASSRASTCAALLLMGFREIGIGAMAQAWIYIGMAVRMAQDLGMQRDADGWVRAGDGKLFGEWEIAERRRIWYACVIMDKYVSTYIGRPLAIFERDFDTSLPSESDAEELEEWTPPPDAPVSGAPRPGRVISCFNASARLSGILSQIVQSIYALRPAASRHAELVVLDGQLEKWHLALPAHLQHDPARSSRSGVEAPLPQVLTLHLQYWCAVLLLHRPFSPAPEEGDVRGNAEKSYELCAGAANHITTIVVLYAETYTLKHCAVFLCYYVFTASIMHVTSLSAHPTDPQARMGLTRCMDALKEMEIVWPAAGRALELLRGAIADAEDVNSGINTGGGDASASRVRKRSAEQTLDDSFVPPANGAADNFLSLRPARSSQSAYYPAGSSPFERWPTEDGGAALAFQGALSTAVMGPAYSTGLVDERHRAPAHEGEARFGQQLPQYWNEYSAFPPLEPGYADLQDPALAVHGEPQIYPLHDFGLYSQNQ